MRLRDRLKAAWKELRFPQAGARSIGGGMSRFLQGLLPGTRKDWSQKVGDRWRSSAVAIALNWICNSFPEAPVCVKRMRADGTDEYLSTHPMVLLLKRPNYLYGPRTLWIGTILSFLTNGNAYWLKVRNNAGMVGEVWYLPHFYVDPQGPEDGSSLIDRYAYTVNGMTTYYKPEDIVHFRYGINPRDQRRGWCPLAEQDRQIAGDNECSTYQAALLENFGIPGLIISSATEDPDYEEEDAERIKKRIAATTTGDERGKPTIIPAQIKVDVLGFSPEQMALDKLMKVPLDRVFGALGLDPMVAGQPSESKTYSNYGEARRGGWENCILPVMALLCEGLDHDLLSEFGGIDGGEFSAFDIRKVKALQDDVVALWERLEQACGGPFITPNEARLVAGYEPMDGQDELREKAPPLAMADGQPMDGKPSPKAIAGFRAYYGERARERRLMIEAGNGHH